MTLLRAETGIRQLQADYGTFKCKSGKPAARRTHARTVTGSIWRVQRVRGRLGRGALRFRDLAWSKPLGPNRIRRPGYYRPRCQRATEARGTHSALFFSLSSERVFPLARLPWVLNQHLPNSDYSPLAVVAAFIHSAVSGAIALLAFL